MSRKGYIDKILAQHALKYDDDLRKIKREDKHNKPQSLKRNPHIKKGPGGSLPNQGFQSQQINMGESLVKSKEPINDLINEMLSLVLFVNSLRDSQIKLIDVVHKHIELFLPQGPKELLRKETDTMLNKLRGLDSGRINSHLIMINDKISKLSLANISTILSSCSTRADLRSADDKSVLSRGNQHMLPQER
jgi:hypothetical protein